VAGLRGKRKSPAPRRPPSRRDARGLVGCVPILGSLPCGGFAPAGNRRIDEQEHANHGGMIPTPRGPGDLVPSPEGTALPKLGGEPQPLALQALEEIEGLKRSVAEIAKRLEALEHRVAGLEAAKA